MAERIELDGANELDGGIELVGGANRAAGKRLLSEVLVVLSNRLC
jgi:hypothetical protein